MLTFSHLTVVFACLFIVAVIFLAVVLKKNANLVSQKEELTKASGQTLFLQDQLDELKKENARLNSENMRLTAQSAALETQMRDEKRHLDDKIAELKSARAELSMQFKTVSADVLKEQSEDFKKNQQDSLGQILTPLKDQLDSFKKRMEEINQINAGG